jgi:hypothetical protein
LVLPWGAALRFASRWPVDLIFPRRWRSFRYF